ncbi:MAG TPA: SH3 domain-containing protein [Kurthia sp.]
MSGKIVGTFSKDEKVVVLSVDENGWAEIKYKSQKSYVFRSYLD